MNILNKAVVSVALVFAMTMAAHSQAKTGATLSVEQQVREYFKDKPVLIKIAECESNFRHWNPNGQVLRGRANSSDIGVMQINEDYHLFEAKALGFDIYDLYGNLAYARYLYSKQGGRPWIASSHRWKKK